MTQILKSDIERLLDKAVFVDNERTKATLLQIANNLIKDGSGSREGGYQLIRQGELLSKAELKAFGLNPLLKFGRDSLQYFHQSALKQAVNATRDLFQTLLNEDALARDIKQAKEIEAEGTPPVVGIQWITSGVADPNCSLCKSMAMDNRYGIGQGIFPLSAIPSIPHLACSCYWIIVMDFIDPHEIDAEWREVSD